jgi:dolichyl-phosphate beta-glucosyltransferase
MDISVIIPVFDESKKIAGDVEAAAAFLNNNELQGEIFVVDDGSRDGTAEVAKSVEIPDGIAVNVIRVVQHHGKGFAVRTGILASTGKYVMFADSGSCVPYHHVLTGLKMLRESECEIAHGSRKLDESRILRPQPLYRRVSSLLFRWFMILAMKIPRRFTDTQCGFKIYRGAVARELYEACTTAGFMFDIEIILRALKRGFHIKEFPIEWTFDLDSRTTRMLSLKQMLRELLTIKQRI